MALRNDSLVRISCGVRFALAAATAFAPVSSAIRRRVDDTAGAEAPRKGIKPRAAVMHAMVLAVPITPQVPDWTARQPASFSVFQVQVCSQSVPVPH